MEDGDRRTCGGCGAANPTDARHCWQCYAPFGTGAPAGPAIGRPARAGFPMPPPVAAPPVASTSRAGGSTALRVVLGVALAFVALAAYRQLMPRGVDLPDQLAGQPRMLDSRAEQLDQQMRAEGARYDVEIQTGIYGSALQPDFVVVVANGSAVEEADELFAGLTEGIEGAGASIDVTPREGELDGASYRCVGARANGGQVGACIWKADDHVGLVMDVDGDAASTEQLTSQIYDELAG